MSDTVTVEIEGRKLRLSNLDKVLYPKSRTTKGEVIDYYSRIAPVMLPHLAGRPVTRKRWPDGVAKQPFFEKNMPRGTPSWIRTVNLPVPGSTMDRETIDFVVLADLAGLVWSANLAALELHVPQWKVGPRGAAKHPDLLVVDLDPGDGAGLADCMEVAVLVRDRMAQDGLTTYPKTSGNKGMQLYAPVSAKQDSSVVSAYAHAIADELAEKHPRKILSQMTKALRRGKIFIDWSQNNAAQNDGRRLLAAWPRASDGVHPAHLGRGRSGRAGHVRAGGGARSGRGVWRSACRLNQRGPPRTRVTSGVQRSHGGLRMTHRRSITTMRTRVTLPT
ncbi:non-homologous end-joining DNA ligase [Fodinicola feengrottensis]|nr:non-homologous end-joining DNA ligase [Fodinicola feengrottensis]